MQLLKFQAAVTDRAQDQMGDCDCGRSGVAAVSPGQSLAGLGGLRPTPFIRGRTSCRWLVRPLGWRLAAA
jgi:hypothetical protein